MGVVEDLTEHNAEFARTRFDPALRPKLATIVVCCADARVDPAVVLGARQGEITAVRNIGGRITPGTLDELAMLRKVAQAVGDDIDAWDLIVMQHTQCGIIRIQDHPDLLASYFQVSEDELPSASVGDPWAAVVRDAGVLRAEPRLEGARVSGLVYDVTTGLVETIVQP